MSMPRVPKNKLEPLNIGGETIGERICRFRKARGMTQQEVADKIGINRVLVTDYEKGKIRLYDDMVLRFAIALEISADKILGLNSSSFPEIIPSLKLLRRVNELEKLPENQQKAILKTIDMMIKAANHD